MKIMQLDIPVGIGDFIHFRGILDDALKFYDQINLGLSFNLLDKYHPEEKEKNIIFLTDLAKLIFNHKKINLNLGSKYGLVSIEQIPGKFKTKFLVPDLRKELTSSKKEIDGDYVVITTKIRDFYKESFLLKKPSFVRELSLLSKKYKIVILGEKEVKFGSRPVPNTIYSIYDTVLDSIKASNNYVDLTIPSWGTTAPSLLNIKKDCTIMKFAKNVITLGSGGNLSLAMCVANVSSYREDRLALIKNWYEKQVNNKFYMTTNWDNYLKKISSL